MFGSIETNMRVPFTKCKVCQSEETVDELLDCAEMCNANRLQAICQHHKRKHAASFERYKYDTYKNCCMAKDKTQNDEYDANRTQVSSQKVS